MIFKLNVKYIEQYHFFLPYNEQKLNLLHTSTLLVNYKAVQYHEFSLDRLCFIIAQIAILFYNHLMMKKNNCP